MTWRQTTLPQNLIGRFGSGVQFVHASPPKYRQTQLKVTSGNKSVACVTPPRSPKDRLPMKAMKSKTPKKANADKEKATSPMKAKRAMKSENVNAKKHGPMPKKSKK